MAENETPSTAPQKAPKKTSSKPASTTTESPANPTTTKGATETVTDTFSAVREKLQAGEQLALSGASLIALVWIVFDLVFDYRTVSSFTLLLAVFTILAIYIHRWGHYDFGTGYRIVVGALGLALALIAVTAFLITIRTGINAGAMQLLGLLLFWVGGVVAGYGAWLVFRVRGE